MMIEIKVPDIGSENVEVTDILVNIGDKIEVEQSLITVEGDKVLMEIPSPLSGIIKELKVNIGDKISTGSIIMIFEIEELTSSVSDCSEKKEKTEYITYSNNKNEFKNNIPEKDIDFNNHIEVHATPLIRRLARELGVNLCNIKGQGPKGRILKEDVHEYVKDAIKKSETKIASNDTSVDSLKILPWPIIDFSKFGEIKEIELERIQKISSANISRNWLMIPHVTLFEKADITDLEKFRKQKNSENKNLQSDIKFTIIVFIMKAVAKALEQMPRFNSSISEDKRKLIIKNYINIGIAVDTQQGLLVPIIKDVNKKGLIPLSYELAVTISKAHEGKLTASNLQGGSFTISSLGNLGTTYFTPIINAPEVAILGISKAIIEPVWNGKEFIPRLMMPMSLSFDHRVIDGADGTRFICTISDFLCDIRSLLM